MVWRLGVGSTWLLAALLVVEGAGAAEPAPETETEAVRVETETEPEPAETEAVPTPAPAPPEPEDAPATTPAREDSAFSQPIPAEPPPSDRPTRDQFDDAPLHLEARFSFAKLLALGVVGEYNTSDRLALGLGIGRNDYGTQFSAHARYRPIATASRRGHTLHALTLQGGIDYGPYAGTPTNKISFEECDLECSHYVSLENIAWARVEVGWEVRFVNHMTLRTAFGLAAALNRPQWQCTTFCASDWTKFLPVNTIALGYAF